MDKAFSFIKRNWKLHRPHIKALTYVVFLLVISGTLSLLFFEKLPALSSISASISAGCITGIIFYLLANIRNNEIRDENEEFKSINNFYDMSRKTKHLCIECLVNSDSYQTHIPQIIKNAQKIIRYLSYLYFSSPRTTKLIKDFPKDYLEKVEAAESSITLLENVDFSRDNSDKCETINHALIQIISFCAQTENILLTPLIELSIESHELDSSVL